MTAAVLMVVFCTAGIGFLVCFFVGLCKEQTCVWICYLVRLHPELGEHSLDRQEGKHERPLTAA
jgi:hypothetical protein